MVYFTIPTYLRISPKLVEIGQFFELFSQFTAFSYSPETDGIVNTIAIRYFTFRIPTPTSAIETVAVCTVHFRIVYRKL